MLDAGPAGPRYSIPNVNHEDAATSINWSDIERRTLLGWVLRMPLRLLPKNMRMPILKGPAKDMSWIVGSASYGCWLGTYELQKQEALERFVRNNMTIYDIGAQAGFYTLFFSSLVGGGKVYAFEPFGENIHNLLSHVGINQLENVRVIQAAASARSVLGAFTVDRGESQNYLVNDGADIFIVPTISLDDAVDVHGLAPPDLVKVDVEGSETSVLEGAHEILVRYQPIVFVALHTYEQSLRCGDILEAVDYQIFALGGDAPSEHQFASEIYALPRRQISKER